MNKTYKAFTVDTLEDAFILIRERLGEHACSVAEKVLQNPAHKDGTACGCIGYKDDRPVCMQAEMLRTMYFRTERTKGLVGGLTCKVKRGCPLSILLETLDRAGKINNNNYLLSFGNTCCGETAKLCDCSGGHSGPNSCTRYLWRAIRPFECVKYFVRRKLLNWEMPKWKSFSTFSSIGFKTQHAGLTIRRLMEVKPDFFDVLFLEYVKTNEGIVCSRTAEEVEWIFGERIKCGQCVLLAAFKGDHPVGYIIINVAQTAKRCGIFDWFALKNNEKILEAILSVACSYLKQYTPAMMLEVCGFPTWIQSLLKYYLPHERRLGNNVFAWSSCDNVFHENVLLPVIDSPKSWFFGPYDGDMCICM